MSGDDGDDISNSNNNRSCRRRRTCILWMSLLSYVFVSLPLWWTKIYC